METFREDLIKKFGKENLARVEETRIGIAGAGGLGSNCALNLVRSGFKKFKIVDFDIITPSNLDRQFYFLDQVGQKKVDALKINLCRVNPELDIKTEAVKITENNIKELFKNCHIIVECLDTSEGKSMLVNRLLPEGRFIVSASGLGGVGSSDEIRTHRIKENFVVVGDLKSDIKDKPAVSPRVNIAAAKEADIVLEYVLKKSGK
ncbi:MAG: sulfur carrier protein ThiS adenylyltransferase ThiF [Candidatus Omnitrophota bacterium]|jgi:sulfur carrier protein ThiS adenylyltransferase